MAVGVHVSNDGKVYVSGYGEVSGNPSEIITIKYALSPAIVQQISSEVPNGYLLHQNCPNPFSPSTRIKYQIIEPGYVSLKVYDILGNEFTTLVNEEISPGTYEATFDASGLSSGIYFYTLRTGSFAETKR